jgi:hypothetical protein
MSNAWFLVGEGGLGSTGSGGICSLVLLDGWKTKEARNCLFAIDENLLRWFVGQNVMAVKIC